MAKKTESFRIAKVLNQIFSNKTFLYDLADMCDNNYNGILFALGDILEYYITSRDERALTVNELNVAIGIFKYVGNNRNYDIKNVKNNESVDDAIKRNVITEGFLTKSTSSAFIKSIKKYGIGNPKTIDDKLNKDFEFLESIFGTNQYSKADKLKNNQFYVTSPGVNSFYHASTSCPKRLFMGILGQKVNQVLPFKLGESKEQYYKRVLDAKIIEKKVDHSLHKKILKVGYKLIKEFCSDRPKIILLPIYNDNYDMKVTKKKNDDYDLMPIRDLIYLTLMGDGPMSFFSRDIGDANGPLGNIISFETIVPYSEIGIFDGFDRFEITQAIAHNKGYATGTLIDYITGEQFSVASSELNKEKKVVFNPDEDTLEEPEADIIERIEVVTKEEDDD